MKNVKSLTSFEKENKPQTNPFEKEKKTFSPTKNRTPSKKNPLKKNEKKKNL